MAAAGAPVPARVGVHGGPRQHPAPARGQAPGLGQDLAQCGQNVLRFHEEGSLRPSWAPSGISENSHFCQSRAPPSGPRVPSACGRGLMSFSASRRAGEDLEAPLVHPHRQLPLLL